ncbi:MAG: DUF86 domain-containing protein [Thermoplasmatota archaeon]
MDKKRINRYRQKISLITKRKSNISTWIKDTDEKSILAVYKAYQETVEAFTDIFAMILKDINEIVEDDYTNIEKLGEKGILDGKEEGLMKEANGLRNRLVHEYNGLERKIAIDSIVNTVENFEDVLEEIRTWLKKQ